ncbi:hypothetical protein ACS0TY_023873 [Phlomoides rotata]
MAYSFPEEVLEHVFLFLSSDRDRNTFSLVCKSWYQIERWCHRRIFVGNCYAVSPEIVIRRFSELRLVEIKGKPHFADFNLVPEGWGGHIYPWIVAMSEAYPFLEEIKLKRMVVTDESLELISKSFKNFKALVLSSCEGFTTDGLASIAANCRLVIAKMKFPFQLLRIGRFPKWKVFWDVVPAYLPAMYSVCSGITSLNLSYATTQNSDLVKLVLDYIEDIGLEALATSCKDLQELRVFLSDPFGVEANVSLTEQGLVSISEGCPKLHSVLCFYRQITNAALIAIAKNQPNFIIFRLCIIEPRAPDYLTLEPLDTSFGAIMENCTQLRCLSLNGLLTNRVFKYIGTHAKKLEMLSIAFAGDSDLGLHHVLSGCGSLRKLEIRDCPFGDEALLANAAKLETMRSLWMSTCSISFGACKMLARKMQRLNIEVIDDRGPPESRPENCPVERVYIYCTVADRRVDMPDFVWTMDEEDSSSLRYS